MTKTALIIVDTQRDFCEGGSLAVAGGARVAASISDLLAGVNRYDHVVATRDHHIEPAGHFSDQPDYIDTWPPHCVVGTPGVEFHDDLVTDDIESVFDKGEYAAAYSGFEGKNDHGQSLMAWLAEHAIRQVDVCGLTTDYCVRATAVDAASAGFQTTVLLDLTAAVAPDRLAQTLAALRAAGVAVSGEVAGSGAVAGSSGAAATAYAEEAAPADRI